MLRPVKRIPYLGLRRSTIWALVLALFSSLSITDTSFATDPTAPVSLSSATFASIYMDAPFVQASYAQTDSSALTETFDNVVPNPTQIASSQGSDGNCPDNIAVGTFSPTYECLIYANDPWFGGATTNSSDPVNTGSHSPYAATHHGPLTITFPTPKTYVGFWWSAGSYGNKVSFLDETGAVVAQLNADDIYNTVTAGTVTAVDGVTSYNSGDYLGHPGDSPQDQPANTPRFDSGEPFVYIHAFASAGKSFKAISLEAPGNGFEFDNLTTADSISVNPRLVKVRDIFTPLTLPTPTSNPGYDFGGWYSDSSFENYLGQPGDPYYPSSSSSSIYPAWNPHWINVYYHDPTNSDYYCNIGGFYNDPYNQIVIVDNNGLGIYCGQGLDKPNSKIVAWNTAADGSGTTYSLFAAYAGSDDLDLYPVWAANTFALSSVPTGHGTITPSGVNNVNSGTSPTYVITPDTGYHIVDVQIDGTSVGPISSYTFPSVSSDQTISATFALNTYTVNAVAGTHGSITPNGRSTLNYGDTPTYTITPDSGYQVASVQVDTKSVGVPTTYTFSPITSDETITVSFVQDLPSNITITYELNGGIFPNGDNRTQSGIFSSPALLLGQAPMDPVRLGYQFDGWARSDESIVQLTDTATLDTTLHAHWTKLGVNITYDPNGGIFPNGDDQIQIAYSLPTGTGLLAYPPSDPINLGYQFDGWARSDESIVVASDVANTDVSLHAHWTKIGININYDLNGGVFPNGDNRIQTSYSLPVGTVILVAPPMDPIRDGYHFDGWAVGRGSTDRLVRLTDTASTDTTIYARWSDAVNISYDPNGGSFPGGSTAPEVAYSVPKGTDLLAYPPLDPSKSGYHFDGWALSPQETATALVRGTGATTDVTLYANWSRSVKIQYIGNGGTFIDGTDKQVADGIPVGTDLLAYLPDKPSRSGYHFDGWALSSSDSATVLRFGTKANSNTDVYANWSPIYAFDANGGTFSDTTTVISGWDSLNKNIFGMRPRDPMRSTYTFVGWSLSASGTTPIKDLILTPGVRAYAIWYKPTPPPSNSNSGGYRAPVPNPTPTPTDTPTVPVTTIQIPATSDSPVVIQTPKNTSKAEAPKRKITVTKEQAKTVISIAPRTVEVKPKILVGNSDIAIKGLSENQFIRVTIKDPNGNTEIATPKNDSELSQLVNNNQKSTLAIEITPTLDGKLKKGARIGVAGAKRADRVRVIIK